MPGTSSAQDAPVSIWDKDHAALTSGIILSITLMALDGLAMATVAPILSDDLQGGHLYGWIFSSFLLAQIIGTVVGGREVDRRSPADVYAAALVMFLAGGLVCGFAPDIEIFLIGRALQGIAAGLVGSTAYSIINVLYVDRLRPSMLAAQSSAWVLPSIFGPFIVGTIAEQWSWRVVFLGMIPFVLPMAMLVLPRFRTVQPDPDREHASDSRVLFAMLLAVSTGLFLVGLELEQLALAVIVSLVGIAGMGFLVKRLMPEGTYTLKPVLPAALVVRSMAFGAFLICETYLVYSLKEFGGVSAGVAGLLITGGALTWSTGSWLQARVERITGAEKRPVRMVAGLASMIAGIGLIFGMIALFHEAWYFVALAGWLLAGLGIGFGLTTAAAVALAESPPGESGRTSSSMLLGDLLGASFGVGIGGALLAFGLQQGWSKPGSVTLAMLPALVFLAIGAIAALRLLASRPAHHTDPVTDHTWSSSTAAD